MPKGFISKEKPANPIAKMVIPGRRALGEEWQEVTIAVKDDKIQVTDNVPAEAPPNGVPIFSLGLTKLPPDALDFILQGAYKAQEYNKGRGRRMTLAEEEKVLNQMWQDYLEQKLAWFKGKTTIGAGGFYQRAVPEKTNWSGVH